MAPDDVVTPPSRPAGGDAAARADDMTRERRRAGNTTEDATATVTARLAGAAKYRDVHPDTIADVVAGQRDGTTDPAELERRSRARLHKVAALHLLTGRLAALRRGMDKADLAGMAEPELRAWCREVLAAHVSTGERLPDLDRFYPAVLDLVPPPATIADLACALNPFTLPWLREHTDAGYTGYDLNAGFVGLAEDFLTRVYPGSHAEQRDVLVGSSLPDVDLALLLKTYHCIEDRRRGAALSLVDQVPAAAVVVSFPTRAMNGRAAVFARRHVADLTELADRRGWRLDRATLDTEDLLVITKRH
ncbi:hypothetical protein Misp01_09980 [Microtetraspora sp. NBRC 13810]|uniref:hypothetical protein n=1 Tax=Microtetraspora sp. NBRC 13810 TaxID=3030990 RepID=UPI0024A5B577|nr:hypothetical protein [Microtetraspora sp. NBRC 13810]GLW05868.1 hypothetical protein Misp01_09980 [Microtetraspora sp. NBRC 13810]